MSPHALPRLAALPRPHIPQTLHCSQCLAQLPLDGGLSMEVEDYVHYFCGLDCLAAWQVMKETLSSR